MRRVSGSEAFLESLAALAAIGRDTTERPPVGNGPPLPSRAEMTLSAIPGLYGVKPRRLNDEMLGIVSPARFVRPDDRNRLKH